MNDKALLTQAHDAIAAALRENDVHRIMASDTLKKCGSAEVALRAAIAQQEAAPSVPMFDSLSNDDGYSWYENPADAELIFGVLGNSAKVGDEFEVTAGWNSTTAKYRITKASTGDDFEVDEFEVECISHKEFRAEAAPVAPTEAQGEPFGFVSDAGIQSMRDMKSGDSDVVLWKSQSIHAKNPVYLRPAVALSEPLESVWCVNHTDGTITHFGHRGTASAFAKTTGGTLTEVPMNPPAALHVVPKPVENLSDEQIMELASDGMMNAAGGIYSTSIIPFARAIESAIKEAK